MMHGSINLRLTYRYFVLEDKFLPQYHNRMKGFVASISSRMPGYNLIQAHIGFWRAN